MRLRLVAVALLCALVPAVFIGGQPKDKPRWAPSPHVAPTEPLRPEQQVKKFHLPPGFEMQLVAADPDIRKPINITFDAAGRLWVTETIEYPFAAPEGKGRDAVKVLEDFGPDGRARKITTFASGLNIPIGVQPLSTREALVFTIPAIHRMTDTDGDGKADNREVAYSGYGYQDTHGMTGEFMWGFDGWVYACHGFANTSKVKSKGETAIQMQSGNTYRFQPDGSRIECFTHGQVNPFGLAFDPLGNLYSADCHTRPVYQLLRGAWYPSFGRPHDGLGFGPEMVTHDHGSTAIAGVAHYADDKWPEEFRDNLFIGNVMTNRINRDRLERHGSTYKGVAMPDFVKCDDPWFRPVDVKLGPDGCLYVADFYNRIIGHYEVPLDHPGRDRDKGRIWRIVYRDADKKNGPTPVRNLATAGPDDLVGALGDTNLTVRLHATHELVTRGGDAGAEAARQALGKGSAFQRAHALWVLERMGQLPDASLAVACTDKEALVRIHAQRVLTERAKWTPELRALAVAGLKDGDAFVQRAAAEALGAHRAAENVPPLLELRHRVPAEDTHLLHSVRMALRDQLLNEATWAKLDPDKMGMSDLHALADVCLGAPNPGAADYLKGYVELSKPAGNVLQDFGHHIVRHGRDGDGRWLLNHVRGRFANDIVLQGNILKTIQQATQERGATPGKEELAAAAEVAGDLLGRDNGQHIQVGIELASAMKLASTQPALLKVATNSRVAEPRRKAAVQAAVAVDPAQAVGPLRGLLLDDKESLGVREQVASALAATNQAEAHKALLFALESAPARLQTVIALGMAASQQGGDRLLDAIGQGKASPRLLQDRAIELKLRQAKVGQLDQRLAKLTRGLPPADVQAQDLIFKRRDAFVSAKPDVTAGHKVFEKHCGTCHIVANKGAKVGPQLDGVGIRGLERLLEDVLDPNRNVDQAFRATTLLLDNGQVMTGLLLREEGEVLVLADAQGKEQRVAKKAVEQRTTSQLSPMPSNFHEQVPVQDFNDLMAYLLAQRAKD